MADVAATESFDDIHITDSIALLTLLVFFLVLLLAISAFKKWKPAYFHETGFGIVLGIIGGLIYRNFSDVSLAVTFAPELFFYVLLIPIIFNSGYDLRTKHFFNNLGAILVYALLGTTLSTFIIGYTLYGYVHTMGNEELPLDAIDCLKFGALISTTDPVAVLAIFHNLHVDVSLYALVFGESILNDAVGIVLFRSIVKIGVEQDGVLDTKSFFLGFGTFITVFLGSIALGILVGILNALVTKFVPLRLAHQLETGFFIVTSYCSYLLAESVGLSGIVSVWFCGMTQSHYTYLNLTPKSQELSRQIFNLLNFLAENFIFIYLGISLFTIQHHTFVPGFIALALSIVLVSRLFIVPLLTFCVNLFRPRHERISWRHQVMLVWAGLRGAIAFALAITDTSTVADQIILTTTLVIVIVTVLVFGSLTAPLLRLLKVKVNCEDEEEIPREYNGDFEARVDAARTEFLLDLRERGCLSRFWRILDTKYLKPVFCVAWTHDMLESSVLHNQPSFNDI